MFDLYEFEEETEYEPTHTRLTIEVYEKDIDRILDVLHDAGIWVFASDER